MLTLTYLPNDIQQFSACKLYQLSTFCNRLVRRKRCQQKPYDMTYEELDGYLWRFYAEVRSKSGEDYSRSTLLGFRNAMERHLASQGRYITITKNPTFQ